MFYLRLSSCFFSTLLVFRTWEDQFNAYGKFSEKNAFSLFFPSTVHENSHFAEKLRMGENHSIFVMLCAICYHLHNLKNVKSIDGVLLFVKLQALACNFAKTKIAPWVFFTFLKLHKWYQTAQSVSFLTTTITYYILVGRLLRLPNYLCSHYCYLNWIPLAFGMGRSTIKLRATFQIRNH